MKRTAFAAMLGAVLLTLLPASVGAQTVESLVMPGEVITGHAKYEHECAKCHQRFNKAAQAGLCLDCHKETAADVDSRTRFHGRIVDPECRECHTDHKGRGADIAPFTEKTFDHAKTEFPLANAHLAPPLKCESCHLPKKKYREAPRACHACHKKIDDEKGHRGALGKQCEKCHDDRSWKESTFDHEKTKFKLKGGKHAEVKCDGCHADKTFSKTPLTCVGCHEKDDRDKKGHQGWFGTKCESCHNDRGWKEITFNHDAVKRYRLRGKHREVECNACHEPGKGVPGGKGTIYQQKLPLTCIGCHRDDDREKGHQGALGEKCESCHTEREWKTSTFDHDKTDFPLKDKHRDAKCDSCHKGGVTGAASKAKKPKLRDDRFKLETTCVSCHRKDDDEKGHKGRYGKKCETCHDARDWKHVDFDHDRLTKYKLRDKHRQAKCDDCHLPAKGSIYVNLGGQKLSDRCDSCHAKDDKHKGQLGKDCHSCHNEKRWDDAPYDHDKSRFPLVGGHVGVKCKDCHETPAYRDTSSRCSDCHEKDNKHPKRYGPKCESCHYVRGWKTWDFDHSRTDFPLLGKHREPACRDCHSDSQRDPAKPGRACVACHLKDDVHERRLSLQCQRCHVADSWKQVRP